MKIIIVGAGKVGGELTRRDATLRLVEADVEPLLTAEEGSLLQRLAVADAYLTTECLFEAE